MPFLSISKMKLKLYLLGMTILVMAVIPVVACRQPEPVSLPDLIIDSVTYRKVSHTDPYGMPILGPGVSLEYTIHIKNIGDAPASGLLYVSNTRSNKNLDENHYPSTELVKYAEPTIEPGEVFVAKILDYREVDAKTVRFIVNPEMELHPGVVDGNIVQFNAGTEYIYRLEESHYNNNTYELEFD